ncbi:helicase-related protein [Lentzea chajnantorensis]
MPDFIQARNSVVESLRAELVGPKAGGKPLDTARRVLKFADWPSARGPWHDAVTGEEILTETGPAMRYGVGVLFSDSGAPRTSEHEQPLLDAVPLDREMPDDAFAELSASVEKSTDRVSEKADRDDFDLDSANAYKPSTMGVTCRVRVTPESSIELVANFGRYESIDVQVGESQRTWFRRRPVQMRASFRGADLTASDSRKIVDEHKPARERTGDEGLSVEIRAYSRPTKSPMERLVTFYVANRTSGAKDTSSLFQSGFTLSVSAGAHVVPYRPPAISLSDDPELASIALLYRGHQTFAVGHGCAADWGPVSKDGNVTTVDATALPVHEAPSITPVIKKRDGHDLVVGMENLALLDSSVAGQDEVEQLLSEYQAWIDQQQTEISGLSIELRRTANSHLDECRSALDRMRTGWQLVTDDPVVRRAFTLANQAMLTQQARSDGKRRAVTLDENGKWFFAGTPPTSEPGTGKGTWRPFQIAFFLATLESTANNSSQFRDTVELIFFPTGGGKTEAYLGLAAFSMFLRRLRDPDDAGTEVLMRYTLRLLTTQQFLRASSLICAMEEIRERTPELGDAEFSIGIWVGGDSTPNSRNDATKKYNQLSSGGQNPFLLLRCPWCRAGFGSVRDRAAGRRKKYAVAGYEKSKNSVRFRCPDNTCHFHHRQLPIYVVDDDLYDVRPTLIIGTVDKFAMLAWRERARAIFGIGPAGNHICSPPGLIIQDELHLISGPLGSMAGLYEGIIEDLCTQASATPKKPKIIASTATIRRYKQQVRDLYGRKDTRLFPPHGLSAGDSYFATWARRPDGSLMPGRRYVGVHAPGLGSMQTVQVRAASALLQAPMELLPDERDPYWTCLTFFNSLRELGNTLTLLQADIPTYLGGMNNRDGLDRARQRWPRRVPELTSRLSDDEVPKAIEDLEIAYGERGCIDVCLASNIIEVGIDIERLSLMTVVGQPKTTSQYIQVSGRVGRRWHERPGLVVTLYGTSKPRDRSHFERFRTYHEQLYAQVEPTSATPFALPVLERAVHGALVAYVRQRGPQSQAPFPVPHALIEEAANVLRRRIRATGGASETDLENVLQRRLKQWTSWQQTKWEANPPPGGDPDNGLIRYPGTSVNVGARDTSWETPSSMRNVDANCRIEITVDYAVRNGADLDEEPK